MAGDTSSMVTFYMYGSPNSWIVDDRRNLTNRRGMPRPAKAMRGAASDFELPKDIRIPEAVRPYPTSV